MRPEVKTTFILYAPGLAGNFLARLFSLSDDTVPVMPKQMLHNWVTTAVEPQFDKTSLYSFDVVVEKFNHDWLSFHAAWVDIYDKLWCESLTDLVHKYDRIVYQIHPFEFSEFEEAIAALPNKQLFYVDLDMDKYGHWVNSAKQRIGFDYRGDEHSAGASLCRKYGMETINLTELLTDDEFLVEYNRVCSIMGIAADNTAAQRLRDNWLTFRGL